jgi:glycosyltransferase involved in cell wall biosynthesis
LRFSIITPSFRNSRWLKLCVASVADQDIDHEHIVQDSCSDDGTQEWLPHDSRVKAFIEKDKGMYDAVNRGLQRAVGDILAYINCDEQYLPGALRHVADFFQRHPAIDVVFANTVIVDNRGEYLCHREPLIPNKHHIRVSGNLPILTCATFFRRGVIHEHHLFFDPHLKDVGDVTWIMRLLESGVKMALLPEFTSVFTETGTNMNLLPNAQREKQMLYASAPAWVRLSKPFWLGHHRLRRLLAGHYRTQPFTFSLYTDSSSDRRVSRHVGQPTWRWIRPSPAAAPSPSGRGLR